MNRHTWKRAALGSLLALGLSAQAFADEIKSIAIMIPEEPNDYGWNQQGFDAAKAVAEKYGLAFLPAKGLGYGDVHPMLRELADDGAGLIIAHASGYNTAAPEIGAERGIPVAIVDRPNDSKPGQVADYTLTGHEGAYLAGILAAKTTRTKTVGICVSAEVPSWNSQSAAFAQGVHAADPSIAIRYAVIGPEAYADIAGGNRVTTSLIGAGADVIFGQGDGASFGMLQAVETNKAVDGGKVWFIDVIGDKTKIDKGNLLSSVVWNLVPVYSAMVEDLKAGTFGTKGYSIQLADDSVHLLHSPYISDDVWSAVMAERERIVSGALKIDPVWETSDVHKLMNAVIDAPVQ